MVHPLTESFNILRDEVSSYEYRIVRGAAAIMSVVNGCFNYYSKPRNVYCVKKSDAK